MDAVESGARVGGGTRVGCGAQLGCWAGVASDQGGELDGVEQNNDFHAIFILASRYSKVLY